MKHLKVHFLGDTGVGITSFLITSTTNVCPEYSVPTVFDNYSIKVFTSGNEINLHLWDICQNTNRTLRSVGYFETDVFCVCFSIDDRRSLENAEEKWIPEIKEECPGVPFILVGMKGDLRYTDKSGFNEYINYYEKKKLIPTNIAEYVADKTGAHCYIECSSKKYNNINVIRVDRK